jgi:hypothetical protein
MLKEGNELDMQEREKDAREHIFVYKNTLCLSLALFIEITPSNRHGSKNKAGVHKHATPKMAKRAGIVQRVALLKDLFGDYQYSKLSQGPATPAGECRAIAPGRAGHGLGYMCT